MPCSKKGQANVMFTHQMPRSWPREFDNKCEVTVWIANRSKIMYVCKRVALTFIRATLFSSNFAWRLLIAIFIKISKQSSLEGEDWRQVQGKQTELFAAGGGRLTTNPQKANRVVRLLLKGDSPVLPFPTTYRILAGSLAKNGFVVWPCLEETTRRS
jgi:hypothetical protein